MQIGVAGSAYRREPIDGERLAAVGGKAEPGTFGMNSDFEDETAEFAWLARLGKETGRPIWFLLTDRPTDPERWRRIMAGVHAARTADASVTTQVAGRPVGVILGVATWLTRSRSASSTRRSRYCHSRSA